MPSRRCLSVAAVLAAALCVAAGPALRVQDLDGTGAYELRLGDARVDGRSFDIGVLSGFTTPDELARALRERFAGRATVTAAPAAHGVVVMIADVRSEQCPACRPMTNDTLDAIKRETLVISFVALPGAPLLGIASNVGGLLDPQPAPARLRYEGTAFAPLRDELDVAAQSVFRFGRGWVGTALVDAPGDGRALVARLQAQLRGAGYRPVDPAAEAREQSAIGAAGQRVSLWTNGERTVGLEWTPTAPGRSTKVVINETFVR